MDRFNEILFGDLFNKLMAVFYGLYFYRPQNDVIKCSKLKWEASGFTARTFSGIVLLSIREGTIENCHQFLLCNNMDEVRVELGLFSVEKVFHLISFLLPVLL